MRAKGHASQQTRPYCIQLIPVSPHFALVTPPLLTTEPGQLPPFTIEQQTNSVCEPNSADSQKGARFYDACFTCLKQTEPLSCTFILFSSSGVEDGHFYISKKKPFSSTRI
jgi:hypothetical protein